MWHYVLHGADNSVRRDGTDSAVAHFIGEALQGADLSSLAVRELYFYSAAQADHGLYDGASVDLKCAIAMILAAAVDDESLPACKFEGPRGQYVNIGLDGEVYLGLNVRQETAERAARERGFVVDISDTPSPYLNLPDNALDPILNDTAWLHISTRVEGEPMFALERWAHGRYGELGHMLRRPEDVSRLANLVHPRAGLALFSAQMIVSVEDARAVLSGATGKHAGAGPDLHLVYERAAQGPLAAVGFHSLRKLNDLLTDVPESSQPRVLVAPKFVAWHPPTVETYVRPDADGVVRSGLGYHVS